MYIAHIGYEKMMCTVHKRAILDIIVNGEKTLCKKSTVSLI